jgi:hypothetical protein
MVNPVYNSKVKENDTLWVLWFQGMINAPKLVKKCYELLCANKPKDFEIVVLDNANINEYIRLPEFVWDKFNKGIITATHLSDIIRMELLCTYGGCWIDSTVYCMDVIPQFMLQGELFMFKLGSITANPVLKMSSWWIYATKGNRLVQRTRDALYRYWEKENLLVDYFALHIIMSAIIDTDSVCSRMFGDVPYYSSSNAHVLQGKLASQYNDDEWNTIKCISPIQKLTYKNRYIKGDIYNYYSAIVDDKGH